jgi:mannitol-1-/sugar-/sorbitol-6-phosphatase
MTNLPNQITCDAVLFDLDGVLIDSTSCIVRHWKAWADRHGLELDKVMQAAHGIRTIETMRITAPHLDADKEAERFTAHEVVDTAGVVAIEGAAQVLASLPAGSWAIVTSGSLNLVKARLAKAEITIPPILITADDVSQGKPAPEPYQAAAKRLGVPSARCVVIEDAPAGVESGKKAGMRVIGIAATYPRETLLAKGADFVIEKISHLTIRETNQGPRLVLEMR